MEGVTDAHDVRIRAAGGSWFVDMHVTVDGDLSVRESHAITERIEDAGAVDPAGFGCDGSRGAACGCPAGIAAAEARRRGRE